jgi:hypothetical protein
METKVNGDRILNLKFRGTAKINAVYACSNEFVHKLIYN